MTELERINKLSNELKRRREIEDEVIRLIGNLEFEKANELLKTLDDGILERLLPEDD